jgi:iron complex transport system substrate-binding protein
MKHLWFVLFFLICCCLVCPDLKAREVKDMIGRSVHVPDRIERIASPYRVSTDMVFALGQQEKLVAVSTRNPNKVFKRMCPDYRSLKLANRDSSVEEFLRLRPDVVFMRPGSLVNKLEQLGISVFCLQVERPQTMIDGLVMISKVLGTVDQAKRIASYFQEKLAYITQKTQDIHPKKSVSLVGYKSLFATCGGDFYQDVLISLAGGRNVAHDLSGGWVSVSREHLLGWDPDVFVFTPYSHVHAQELFSDPTLTRLRAVKQRQVFTFPAYLDAWDLPTPESILGIMWLAKQLYPEQIDWDMEKEARSFYTQFYGQYPCQLTLEDERASSNQDRP